LRFIVEPYFARLANRKDYARLKLGAIYDLLKDQQTDFLFFLREKGLDHRLVQEKLHKLIRNQEPRNRAAHRADMLEPRARDLRDDWLGVGRNGDSIFRALVPK
jgi:hypothetical protein